MPSYVSHEPVHYEATASEEQILLEEQESLAPRPSEGPRRALLAGLGLALVGAAAALLLPGGGGAAPLVAASVKEATMLVEPVVDPCESYPWIQLVDVARNNLGGRGPSSGAEGLVYNAVEKVPGKPDSPILVSLNVVEGLYFPNAPKENGLNGSFGTFNMLGGSSVKLKMTLLDKTTNQPVFRQHFEFSYFDLDMHDNNETREFVTIWGSSSYVVTNTTELLITVNTDNSTSWDATTPGTGADNPTDPLRLTVQQKNRAVTVAFENFTGCIFQGGSHIPGFSPRYASFVTRPVLRCAETKGTGTAVIVEIVNGSTTTTTTTTTQPPKQCWFYIFKWCFPKLF